MREQFSPPTFQVIPRMVALSNRIRITKMVRQRGFEPPTYGSGVRRSIQAELLAHLT